MPVPNIPDLRGFLVLILLVGSLGGCRSVGEFTSVGGGELPPEAETPFPYEPLHNAVRQNDHDAVQRLLEAGADLNEFDDDGQSPLHVACRHGRAKIARELLEAGADVNPFNRQSQTPVFVAKDNFHDDVAAVLAEYGGETGWGFSVEGPPFVKAVAENDRERFGELLDTGLNVDERDKLGGTPLIIAAYCSHMSFARRLLEAGADVNKDGSGQGARPLHIAVLRQNETLVKLLLESGADIDAVQLEGATPLLIAAQMNLTAVAEALVKAGANVNASDDRSKITPLQYAAIEGNSELAMLLLENKANPNISGHEDSTALHLAAQYGSHKVATLLITNKANVNARNDNRATPLHIAATHGRLAVVTLLLDHNASVDVKDKRGYTALRYAQEAKHERICQLLEKHANR